MLLPKYGGLKNALLLCSKGVLRRRRRVCSRADGVALHHRRKEAPIIVTRKGQASIPNVSCNLACSDTPLTHCLGLCSG
jgi:hypothetical protein